MDGTKHVTEGNFWDFHTGCCWLDKYKNIKLGNWNGFDSLARLLSLGLKKKIKELCVNPEEFELLRGNGN